MNLTRLLIDKLGQCIHVGREQLLQSAVLKYLINDGMLLAQVQQGLFIGCKLLCLSLFRIIGDLQMVEQNLAQLLR